MENVLFSAIIYESTRKPLKTHAAAKTAAGSMDYRIYSDNSADRNRIDDNLLAVPTTFDSQINHSDEIGDRLTVLKNRSAEMCQCWPIVRPPEMP
jgi:hypothetical protein